MSTPTLFRKKPVVVSAMQLTHDSDRDVVQWLEGNAVSFHCLGQAGDEETLAAIVIETLEGNMRAELTDWIICGVSGEFYPCKHFVFEQTYEAAA